MSDTVGVSFFQFVHRVNPDKTIDAICAFCFLTAASADNEKLTFMNRSLLTGVGKKH